MVEDKLLVRRFKCGSRDALCRIYQKYEDYLLTVARNLLGSGHAAEDVVQDVFVAFVEGRERFVLKGSLRSYLAVCVANRCRERGEVLPWSHLNSGPSEDFLWLEREKAMRGEYTPDCRRHGCRHCGQRNCPDHAAAPAATGGE